jgi:SAM-dependent methyltransferase
MPNDEPEIQRLNEQHWILTQVKGGRLHHAPLHHKSGMKILDVGCGSGIWCIQMAEDYPKALIFGMDVSPIQPHKKLANVEWITHDMEKEWPYPDDYFDYIHLSLVHGCVGDWSNMMAKMTRHLAPGGWIEHQEFSLCRQYLLDKNNKPLPMSDEIGELRPFFQWNRYMERAALKRGRQLQLGPHLKTFQKAAGLLEVNEVVFPHKWGTWPSDPTERFLGARTMLSAMSGVEGFTTILFTKALGWSLEDTQAFIVKVKRDMRDDSLRKVMDLHVVYGQKPGGATETTDAASFGWPEPDSLRFSVGMAAGVAVAVVASIWLTQRRC